MPRLLPVVGEAVDVRKIGAEGSVGIHAKSCVLKPCQGIPLAGWLLLGWEVQGVGEKVQASRCHNFGIELTQCSGTGVAGVGKQSFTARLPFRIDLGESVVWDKGFTANLHPLRWIVEPQAERNCADGAHVGGDLLAALAVSPCGCPFENPVAVTEGKRVAIDFQLTH